MTINPQSLLFAKLDPVQFQSLNVEYSKLWWKCSEKLPWGRLRSVCNRGKGVLGLSAAALPPPDLVALAPLQQLSHRSHGQDMAIHFR